MKKNEAGDRYKFKPVTYGMRIVKAGPVLRETDACIWIMVAHGMGGVCKKRYLKSAGPYFDTEREAKDYLVRRAADSVAACERNLSYEREQLRKAEQIVIREER